MRKWRGLLGLVLLALLSPAQAHLLKVFASAQDNRVEGYAYFAGGARAGGARIALHRADDSLLAEQAPDAEGNFSFTLAAAEDLRVVASTADGHRAEWPLAADEFPQALPRRAAISTGTVPLSTPAHPPDADLEALVERAVARQLKPLREAMAAESERTRLRDVLGGLGYILGLAGLTMWLRGRRP